MYVAYKDRGCSLLILNLYFQAQAPLAADWKYQELSLKPEICLHIKLVSDI